MRQNCRGHTDRNTVTAQHQQTRNLCRKQYRLLFASIVVGNKIGNVIVEHCFISQLRERTLGVTRRSRSVTCEQVSEVSLGLDKIRIAYIGKFFAFGLGIVDLFFAASALVGKNHDSISDRGISVRMIMHCVADDIGGFCGASVFVCLIERPHDAPLHGFQSVIDIRNRAGSDHITCVIKKVAIHHRTEIIVASPAFFSDLPCEVFVINRINGIIELFITHNRLPPGSA